MIQSEIIFRVRYNEVDRMGYVHHGNYAAYFEMGRTELMREFGIVYKELEDNGYLLPLAEYKTKFLIPAKYDEVLTLRTSLSELKGVRMIFGYEIFNSNKQLVATGSTSLVFVSAKSGKPVRPPEYIVEKLNKYFM